MKNDTFYKNVVESSPEAYAHHQIVLDDGEEPVDYIFLDANLSFEKMTGLSKEMIIGKKVTEIFPDIKDSGFDWIGTYSKVARTGEKARFRQYYKPLKRWYNIEVSSDKKGYFTTFFSDITDEAEENEVLETLIDLFQDNPETENGELDYKGFTDKILKMSGAKLALINTYNEDGTKLITNAVSFQPEKTLGIGKTHVVSIDSKGKSIGNFVMLMPEGKTISHLRIIETFAEQTGLLIERKRNEEMLVRAKNDYKLIANLTGDIIAQVDEEYRWVFLNDTACEFWGGKREDLLGQNFLDYLHYADRQDIFSLIEELKSNKIIVTGLVNRQRAKKGWRIVEWNATPLYKDGQYIGFQATGRDITTQKETELKLREKQLELKEAQRMAKLGRWDLFHKEEKLYWDDSIYEIFEMEQNALHVSKDTFLNLAHPDDRELVKRLWKESLSGKKPYAIEHRILLSDGRIKWLKDQCETIYTNEGEPIHSIGVIQDITEIKNVQEALLEKQKELDTFFTSSLDLLCIISSKGEFLRINPEWENVLGYPMEDMVGKSLFNYIHKDDIASARRAFSDIANQKEITSFLNRYCRKNGEYRWIEWRAKSIGDHIYAAARDITPHIRMQNQLSEQEQKYRLVAEGMADVVWTADLELNITFVSPSINELTLETPLEHMEKRVEDRFDEEGAKKLRRALKEQLSLEENGSQNKNRIYETEIRHKKKDGSYVWVSMRIKFLRNAKGEAIGLHGVTRDITRQRRVEIERNKRQEEIEYLSFHDHLTGLYNRRFFEAELKRLDVRRNLPLTVIIGDVNGLKLINDSLGHASGDELLVKVAKILKMSCRSDEIIARIGGDEYAILLPKTGKKEAEHIIERIRKNCKNEKVGGIDISISFGCATKRNGTEEIEAIIKIAEDTMYNNKMFEAPSVRGGVIDNIINAINNKSPREEAHSRRVSVICEKMGVELGLDETQVKEFKTLGLLHDIGKIAVSDSILNKASALTDREYAEIKRHSEIGYRILGTVSGLSKIADYVLMHHERWDGQGYPKGLKATDIPLPARVCAIADAYDAMTGERSYREAYTKEHAVEELLKNAGSQFDPALVDIFVNKILTKDSQI